MQKAAFPQSESRARVRTTATRETIRKPLSVTTNAALLPAPACGCVHFNALTCLAKREHLSRFEAMLTFATGDIDMFPGHCSCPCHRGPQNEQVSRATWVDSLREGAHKPGKAVRA